MEMNQSIDEMILIRTTRWWWRQLVVYERGIKIKTSNSMDSSVLSSWDVTNCIFWIDEIEFGCHDHKLNIREVGNKKSKLDWQCGSSNCVGVLMQVVDVHIRDTVTSNNIDKCINWIKTNPKRTKTMTLFPSLSFTLYLSQHFFLFFLLSFCEIRLSGYLKQYTVDPENVSISCS